MTDRFDLEHHILECWKITDDIPMMESQGLGHDGSRESKDKALEKLIQLLTKPGWWIESSDALRNVLLNRGVTPISDQQFLQRLFNDPNLHMTDNGTYKRELPDRIITESVFGNPELR